MPFDVGAAVTSLPVFCASPGQASVLEKVVNFLEDGNYQLSIRACPSTLQQGASNVFLPMQSFEDQISVPAGSFLTMIGGKITGNTDGNLFRVQFYDAGAQAPISDNYVNSNCISGRFDQLPQTGTGMLTTVSASKNLFILPSPLSISSPGQLNVMITSLSAQTVTIDMAFFFAVPMAGYNTVNGAIIGNAVRK